MGGNIPGVDRMFIEMSEVQGFYILTTLTAEPPGPHSLHH